MDITNYHITYLQYQLLATNFTTWLFDAAKRSGVELTYLAPTEGKLPLTEYQRLAAAIVANGVVVPAGARDDLAQMISIRKEVWSAVRALLSKDDYIIPSLAALEAPLETLRNIREMLDPETRIQQAMEALDLLSLTELAITLVQSTIPKPTFTGAQRKKTKKQQRNLLPPSLSPSEQHDEALFAWLSFFHDVAALRTSIRDVWTLYAAAALPLTHAALLTNTAVDMLRHTAATYLRLAPTLPPAAPHVCTWVFAELTALLPRPGGNNDDPATWTPAQRAIADWTCYHTRRRLVATRRRFHDDGASKTVKTAFLLIPLDQEQQQPGYCSRVQDQIAAAVHECMYDVWDEEEEKADACTHKRKLSDFDDWWMQQLYMEVHHISLLPDKFDTTSLTLLDAVTGRCADSSYRKPGEAAIPLDITLGYQVLFDVRHVLRSRVDAGFKDLNAVADAGVAKIQAYFRAARSKDDRRGKEARAALDGMALDLVKDTRKYVKEDVVLKDFETFVKVKKLARNEKLAEKAFFLLKNHPLLCGMLAWREQTSRWYFQVMVTRCSWEVTHAAHLYNALRVRGGMTRWPDMEFLLGTEDGKNIFVKGSRPTTMSEVVEQWKLIRKGLTKVMPSEAPAKVFEPFWGYGWAKWPGEEWVDQPADERLAQVLASVDEKTARAWMDGTGQNSLTGPQVLELIQIALKKEEEILHWDYVSVVTRCRDMIGALHANLVKMVEKAKQGKQASVARQAANADERDDILILLVA